MGKIDRITILKWDNKSEARKKATLLFCIFQSYGILIWKQNCEFFLRKSLCLHFVLRAGGEKRNFLSDTMDGHRHHFHHYFSWIPWLDTVSIFIMIPWLDIVYGWIPCMDTMDGQCHHFHHDGFWGGPVCGNEKNYRIGWIEIYKWWSSWYHGWTPSPFLSWWQSSSPSSLSSAWSPSLFLKSPWIWFPFGPFPLLTTICIDWAGGRSHSNNVC